MNRRDFLTTSAALTAAAALPSSILRATTTPALPKGKAEHVISVWLGGGMGQVDTFDPKKKGDPSKKVAGSYYDSIPTAVKDVRLCEHFPKLAPLMDRVTAVRTVNHEVIDEHAAATNWMHVGRPVSGTVVYPSFGSIIAHERGAATRRRAAVCADWLPQRVARSGFPWSTGQLSIPDRHWPRTGWPLASRWHRCEASIAPRRVPRQDSTCAARRQGCPPARLRRGDSAEPETQRAGIHAQLSPR